MTLEEIFNERLVQVYGNDPLLGIPKYRVVWSAFQTEKRYGSYDVLTQETGLWLGSKTGLVEIKKYWYFKTDCWVLERVEPNTSRQDIFHDKFTYEPILPFVSKDDIALPLNWRAIEFVVSKLNRAEKKLVTESEHREQEEKKQKEEEEVMFGLLDKPEPTKSLPTFKTSTLIH
jgi:hypothetical protein